MYVGVCRITLDLPDNRSLKGKRNVVRSVCDRLRSRFRVAVAEVGGEGLWQRTVVGVVTVSGDGRVAREVLERAAEYADSVAAEAVMVDTEFDVFKYGEE